MSTWQSSSSISLFIITSALSLPSLTLSDYSSDFSFSTCTPGNDLGQCPARKTSENMYRKMVPNLKKWFEKAAQQRSEKGNHWLSDVFPIDSESMNYVRRVQDAVFSKTYPTPLNKAPLLAGVSPDAVQEILDLDMSATKSQDFLEYISGSLTIPNYSPLAHRYGGHQFGYWAGQLGDGRAIMIGEYKNDKGERWELQLKGSGLTPYSRTADGRAVIRSSVREFLCSEAMYYLGIPTSRAASLVISKDNVIRDQFYNGRPKVEPVAVVLRLAQSWFRIGSLEILAYSEEVDLLRQLVDYMIEEHFKQIDKNAADKYLTFLADVVERTAKLMAHWQSVGFTHGVMNTDNFSLLGITIDYGPFGFLDEYNPNFIPNTSDDDGRYSYRKQPEVGWFNMRKLGTALLPLLASDQTEQVDIIVKGYMSLYKQYYLDIFRTKLGLTEVENGDETLIDSLLLMMQATRTDFTMTFRQLGDVTNKELKSVKISSKLWALHRVATHESFSGWTKMYLERLDKCRATEQSRMDMMHKNNPRYVLRNWMAQAVIKDVENEQFTSLEKMLRILQKPFEEQPEAEKLGYAAMPPSWAKQIKVSCSS